jgi:nucleoside-diphosphate-sugar epimerase
MSQSKLVFITGGTGYLGRHVIPALIARGHRVRALVRHGSQAKAPRGCEIVVGDPFDRATFAHAIAPCDTFLQLVGVPHPSPSKARQFIDVDLRSALESIVPIYWLLERLPSTRETTRRLGLVTVSQMVHALVDAIEHPPDDARIVGVPEMKTRF